MTLKIVSDIIFYNPKKKKPPVETGGFNDCLPYEKKVEVDLVNKSGQMPNVLILHKVRSLSPDKQKIFDLPGDL